MADDNPVLHIFARAERVFEARVDTILNAKRQKARLANTPFNARKAKRDARTVAGREKLDALVRRLADLAYAQHAALDPTVAANVTDSLQGAAAAVLASAVLHAQIPSEARQQAAEAEVAKDLLDTSSCSDDGASIHLISSRTPPDDSPIFPATESVVNFVLQSDDAEDDTHAPQPPRQEARDTDSERDSDRERDLNTQNIPTQSDWLSPHISAPELQISDHLHDHTFNLPHISLSHHMLVDPPLHLPIQQQQLPHMIDVAHDPNYLPHHAAAHLHHM